MAVVRNLIVRAGADFGDVYSGFKKIGSVSSVASSRIKKSTSSISSSADKVGKSIKKMGPKGVSSYKSLRNEARNTETVIKKTADGMKSSVSGLSSLIYKALAIVGVASFTALAKQAIESASDLEEVQNVVDTAFGDMADSAEKFAAMSETWNLSELQAKQTSSTYMAMAKSLGLTEEAASSMSLAATALTGDMSSFFNKSQDETASALKSIFTGETEALKTYGVVMSDTTLGEYALAKGITKSYSDMTQAEKVSLRYAYVMEKLNYVQGDAAKTADSWANKTRSISERFKSILSIFGAGLINVLVNAFGVIDKLLDKIETFASVFQTVTEKLFGNADSGGSSASQIAEDVASATSSSENLTDSITEAGEAAERATAGFDKLNKLSSSSSDSSSSSSGDFDLGNLDGVDDFYTNLFNADDVISDDTTAEIEKKADWVVGKIEWLKVKFSDFKDWLKDKFGLDISFENVQKDIKNFVEFLSENKEKVLAILAAVLGAILVFKTIKAFSTIKESVTKLVNIFGIVSKAGTAFSGVIAGIGTPVLVAVAAIAALIGMLVYLYQTNDECRETIHVAWEQIKGIFEGIGSIFSEIYNGIIAPILSEFGIEFSDLGDMFTNVGIIITNAIGGFVMCFNGAIQTVVYVINKTIGNVSGGIVKFVDGIIEIIGGIIKFLTGVFTGDWSQAWDGIVDIFSGAIDVISGIIDSVIGVLKSIKDLPGNVVSGVQTAANKVLKWAGVSSEEIKGYASGGVVYGDSIIRVGEYAGASSNPEVVAPQNIIKDTMADANGDIVDALYMVGSKISKAVEDNRAVVNVGGKQLANDVTSEQNRQSKIKGKPILSV
jgi:hypothetical protein